MLQKRKPSLLIVDDDQVLLELLRGQLATEFEVTATSEALTASELLRERAFDLHLYDVCMEELPGIELLMLTLSTSDGGPVVLMTGNPTVESAVAALRAGAVDLLLKPLDFARLGESLQDAMAKAAERPQSNPTKLEAVHEALTRAVEAKDPTTHGHGDRVRAVCRQVGRTLGLSYEDCEILDRAAALHDIGKIGIPDHILGKPGSLTKSEFAVIQRHPEVGARILEPIPNMDGVRECVLCHHERWDGSGYPRGLREDEVSRPGRVLIVAEVFDALAHARCYKPAWEKNQIQSFFVESAGSHFDPRVAEAFLEVVERDFDSLVSPVPLGLANSA